MKDLFGSEFSETTIKGGHYQERKRQLEYKKSSEKSKCCKLCKFAVCHTHQKNYYKCKLIGESSSSATDIRLNYVCKKFEEDKSV